MKKIFIPVFLLIGLHSFGQFNKNRIMINGRGNFYTDKQEKNLSNSVPYYYYNEFSEGNLNLNIGYFLSDNFAIGALLGAGMNKNLKDEFYAGSHNSETVVNKNFYSGIFLRYNQMIKQSKFGLFFQLNNLYGIGKMNNNKFNNGIRNPNYLPGKNYMFKIGATPGLMYFITNRLSIETSIGDVSYVSTTTIENRPLHATESHKTSRFNTDFSISTVYFGLTFYLG